MNRGRRIAIVVVFVERQIGTESAHEVREAVGPRVGHGDDSRDLRVDEVCGFVPALEDETRQAQIDGEREVLIDGRRAAQPHPDPHAVFRANRRIEAQSEAWV